MRKQSNNSLLFFTLLFGLLILGSHRTRAANLPADVMSQLNSYNEAWTSPSTNGSPGSMPIGNGDIAANVWVENGGDLMMYIGKSDTWSEGTRLLKIGRERIHLPLARLSARRSICIMGKLTLPPARMVRKYIFTFG
jgi:hypothetical protein